VVTQTLPSPAGTTSFEVRRITEPELRQSTSLFLGAVHVPPVPEDKWEVISRSYHVARTFGAFDQTGMIGTASSFPSTLTVPGGAVLSAAAVTDVGVRADRRRRGVLTTVMRTQLAEVAAAGEVFAILHASEPVIYGRFGYGIGTRARTITVTPRRAQIRPDVPGAAGEVRFLTNDETLALLPAAYDRLATRPGMMRRDLVWWTFGYERQHLHGYLRTAAHFDESGAIDGFLAYETGQTDDPHGGARLKVTDFHAASQPVANDLWRFLIGVDLVKEVVVYVRPMDDPFDAMLVNTQAARSELDDGELWLRLVDVPAALAARTYGAGEPVVVEVRDRHLPGNAGRYLIGPQGTERTTAEPGLSLDVDVLGMLYLGAWRASALAGIGRIDVHDASALAAADRLFATADVPWCGTLF
jgi:predicted acetyltransferase